MIKVLVLIALVVLIVMLIESLKTNHKKVIKYEEELDKEGV